MFAVGYQVGPHFVGVLRAHGLRYFGLTIVVALIGLATAWTAQAALHLPHGGLAGLIAGSLTTTPMLAAAQEAVRSGLASVPAGSTAEQVIAATGTTYAITYVIGVLGVTSAIKLLPRLAGVDLVVESRHIQDAQTPVASVADDRKAAETDMIGFTFGIALGSAIGLLSIEVAGISLGLGSAGGLLLSGMVVGWASSRRPSMARFPEAARWILSEFGLLIFICGVGLQSGRTIVETLRTSGPGLLVAAAAVVIAPIAVGYLFGRWVLRLPPVLLLGALTGAMTSGPALGLLTQEAESAVPALGYAGTYALATIVFTVMGTLLMTF
jgi:AspT/YidE/YbjL antiporter-like protein